MLKRRYIRAAHFVPGLARNKKKSGYLNRWWFIFVHARNFILYRWNAVPLWGMGHDTKSQPFVFHICRFTDPICCRLCHGRWRHLVLNNVLRVYVNGHVTSEIRTTFWRWRWICIKRCICINYMPDRSVTKTSNIVGSAPVELPTLIT